MKTIKRNKSGQFIKGERTRLGAKHTKETKIKMSEFWVGKRQGKNHPNWRGGKEITKRCLHYAKYKEWRSRVFKRDNWTCQTCGERSKAGKPIYLEPHHIKGWAKYPKLRYEVSNGVTLCLECHRLTRKKN